MKIPATENIDHMKRNKICCSGRDRLCVSLWCLCHAVSRFNSVSVCVCVCVYVHIRALSQFQPSAADKRWDTAAGGSFSDYFEETDWRLWAEEETKWEYKGDRRGRTVGRGGVIRVRWSLTGEWTRLQCRARPRKDLRRTWDWGFCAHLHSSPILTTWTDARSGGEEPDRADLCQGRSLCVGVCV